MSYKTNAISTRLGLSLGWKSYIFPLQYKLYSQNIIYWLQVYLAIKAYFEEIHIRLVSFGIKKIPLQITTVQKSSKTTNIPFCNYLKYQCINKNKIKLINHTFKKLKNITLKRKNYCSIIKEKLKKLIIKNRLGLLTLRKIKQLHTPYKLMNVKQLILFYKKKNINILPRIIYEYEMRKKSENHILIVRKNNIQEWKFINKKKNQNFYKVNSKYFDKKLMASNIRIYKGKSNASKTELFKGFKNKIQIIQKNKYNLFSFFKGPNKKIKINSSVQKSYLSNWFKNLKQNKLKCFIYNYENRIKELKISNNLKIKKYQLNSISNIIPKKKYIKKGDELININIFTHVIKPKFNFKALSSIIGHQRQLKTQTGWKSKYFIKNNFMDLLSKKKIKNSLILEPQFLRLFKINKTIRLPTLIKKNKIKLFYNRIKFKKFCNKLKLLNLLKRNPKNLLKKKRKFLYKKIKSKNLIFISKLLKKYKNMRKKYKINKKNYEKHTWDYKNFKLGLGGGIPFAVQDSLLNMFKFNPRPLPPARSFHLHLKRFNRWLKKRKFHIIKTIANRLKKRFSLKKKKQYKRKRIFKLKSKLKIKFHYQQQQKYKKKHKEFYTKWVKIIENYLFTKNEINNYNYYNSLKLFEFKKNISQYILKTSGLFISKLIIKEPYLKYNNNDPFKNINEDHYKLNKYIKTKFYDNMLRHIHLFRVYFNPQLLSEYIALELEQTKNHRLLFSIVRDLLKWSNNIFPTQFIDAIKIIIRGKINRKTRTNKYSFTIGRDLALTTFNQAITQHLTPSRARIGVFGVKVISQLKHKSIITFPMFLRFKRKFNFIKEKYNDLYQGIEVHSSLNHVFKEDLDKIYLTRIRKNVYSNFFKYKNS